MKSLLSTLFLALTVMLFVACEQGAGDQGEAGVTPGGYEYVLHVDEEGPTPQPGEMVFFNVMMSNGDTTTYSSYNQPNQPRVAIPEQTNPGQKASPVIEMLELMSIGDSATLYFPIDSMQGQRPPAYQNAEQVIYELTISRILTQEEFAAEQAEMMAAAEKKAMEVDSTVQRIVEQYAAGELADQLETTESGLEILMIEEGDGPQPQPGQEVVANYYGVLTDGTEFDNSYKRGREFSFPLGRGRVIQGWDEGFAMLPEGSTAVLFVPAGLAYGATERPGIPANSDLVFYVKLEDIR